jgi:hypothetical protein
VTGRRTRVFGVFGFASTHDALDAEAALLRCGIEVVPIPAPKNIGALCGIALRIAPEQVDLARACLVRTGIDIAATSEIEDL